MSCNVTDVNDEQSRNTPCSISTSSDGNDIFSNDYTLNFWVYPLDDTRAIYLGDYQTTNGNKFNFERRAGGGNFRFWHNGADVNGAGSLSELNAPIN